MKLDREELARFIATLGVAMVVSGFLRYVIQGELLTFSKGLLIAGGVFLLAAIVLGFKSIIRFFSKRSSQQGTNTIILSIAVLVILGIANWVGFRHPKRFDLTTEKLYTLSDQTRQIVGGLQQDVKVIRFDKTPNPQFDDLLAQYKRLNSHLSYRTVDPNQDRGLADEYGATRMGDTIVASGARKEHLDAGAQSDVSEQDLTGAIIKAINDKVKTVCFITGHGEHSITDSSEAGYSQVDDGLKKENYTTKSINLITGGGVPADCTAVVDAGPTQAFFPQEVVMVTKFLDGGGKALLLVDPRTDPKLDDIFSAWNIAVGNNIVVDASGMGQMIGGGPLMPIVVDFGDSTITKGFTRSMTFFPLARTVSIADKNKPMPALTELLKTSERSFAIPKLDPGQKEVKFDPKVDTQGPLSLGVSGERQSDGKKVRIVVIGNSQFAANPFVAHVRNGDLFYNSISWLAEDESLISIRPKSATNRTVNLSQAQRSLLVLTDIFLIPGLVFFSGIYIWWKRR